MDRKSTVLLNRTQISALLDFGDYFDAVEAAFKSHGEKKTLPQGLLHLDSEGGEFHVKAGGLKLEQIYFGLKCNGAFSKNMPCHGLPNILGTITLCDGETGYPLAIMDSVEITRQRTAAAAAVAAKYLARPDICCHHGLRVWYPGAYPAPGAQARPSIGESFRVRCGFRPARALCCANVARAENGGPAGV